MNIDAGGHVTLKVLCLAVVVLTAVALVPTTAGAVSQLSPTNTDSLTLGALVAGPLTNQILNGPEEPVLGDLTARVYQNGGVYTYVYLVDLEVNNISGFQSSGSTPIPGLVSIGYSFTDAFNRGGTGGIDPIMGVLEPNFGAPVFEILYFDGAGENKRVFWGVSFEAQTSDFWSNANLGTMQFHIQSTSGPGQGVMQLVTAVAGAAVSYAPSAVPEPATMLLLGSGLAGFSLAGFRKRLRR